MIVTIDGPAGAGKSTVASRLAERLGFRYLDTGAMYRALTWLAMQEGIDLGEGERLGELARKDRVELDESGRVSIAGSDVTSAIRQSRIDRMVPVVARHPEVREVMRERQRELAELGDAVIEGRDIGTVVCPDRRREGLSRRRAPRARGASPGRASRHRRGCARHRSARARRQRPRPDAARRGRRVIDTSDLDVENVVDRIEAIVRSRSERSLPVGGVDRSFPTDERAEPARPDDGTASGA